MQQTKLDFPHLDQAAEFVFLRPALVATIPLIHLPHHVVAGNRHLVAEPGGHEQWRSTSPDISGPARVRPSSEHSLHPYR